MTKCIYCGFCQEACPGIDALVLFPHNPTSFSSKPIVFFSSLLALQLTLSLRARTTNSQPKLTKSLSTTKKNFFQTAINGRLPSQKIWPRSTCIAESSSSLKHVDDDFPHRPCLGLVAQKWTLGVMIIRGAVRFCDRKLKGNSLEGAFFVILDFD